MLCDRVHQGVARLGVLHKQASDSGGQWAEVSSRPEEDRNCYQSSTKIYKQLDAVIDEVFVPQALPHSLDVGNLEHLIAKENKQGTHLLQRPQRLPSDHWNLHSACCAND